MTPTWKRPQKTFDMKVLRELNPVALDYVDQQPLLLGSDPRPEAPAFFESGEKTKEVNSGREEGVLERRCGSAAAA